MSGIGATNGQEPQDGELLDSTQKNDFEDLLADGNSRLFMVSTNDSTHGRAFKAKKVHVHTQSAICVGQMSEATVQQLSRDHGNRGTHQESEDTADDLAEETQSKRFEQSYGRGQVAINT
jgi:hypothetical protein